MTLGRRMWEFGLDFGGSKSVKQAGGYLFQESMRLRTMDSDHQMMSLGATA
jgi:hypothetical protein